MIRSFRHKGLRDLFLTGRSRGVSPALQKRAMVRLDALDNATGRRDLNLPGFDFHRLRGQPARYSIHVSGPWCITFEWREGDAWRVDPEQYH